MYNYPIYSVTYPQYFKSGTPKPDPEPTYYPERFTYAFDNNGVYCVSGIVSDYINEPEIVVPKTDTEGNVVEGIKDYAFKNAKAQNVIILNNIIKIGNYAFDNCKALENIKLSESITTVGYFVFRGCSKLLDLTIPKGIITFPTGTNQFLGESYVQNVTIAQGREVIPNYMISGARYLQSIIIPDSVITIGNYAFSNCIRLASIELPESIRTMGSYVFSGCNALKILTIPNSLINLSTTISPLNSSYITKVIFKEGKTEIPENMCRNSTSIIDIDIPSTLQTVKKNAFYGCSKLATINYNGTEEMFNAITVESGNPKFLEATVIFNE